MLQGVRVLDLATLAAAPLVATYLGEFGADVIKVEEPRHGDPIRGWGNQREGVGLMWKSMSRNKRSITLDLRCTEGQALVRRLVEHADVSIVTPDHRHCANGVWTTTACVRSTNALWCCTLPGTG
jgi:crotonobetainyl-CoA:carnitine CoA-transferase CaiB-like acyl-CoA transferase